jgi:hypothetical protein
MPQVDLHVLFQIMFAFSLVTTHQYALASAARELMPPWITTLLHNVPPAIMKPKICL